RDVLVNMQSDLVVAYDKHRHHHFVPAASHRDIRVSPAEVPVRADLDDCAVFLQHGAVRDLVPTVAVDRMRHHGATADQRCGHVEPPQGNCASQWLAMSIRRAIQASPRLAICRRILSSAPMRPGRPIIRRCSPIDIIFGACTPSRCSQSKASIAYAAKSAAPLNRLVWKNCMSLVSNAYGSTRCRLSPICTKYGRSSL